MRNVIFAFISQLIFIHSSQALVCGGQPGSEEAYFGDLHVHTSYSIDSYLFDNRNTPYDAYKFARGGVVFLPPLDENDKGTIPVQLEYPLDFAAVTDHSEYLAPVRICTRKNPDGTYANNSNLCTTYRSGDYPWSSGLEELCMAVPQVCSNLSAGVWSQIVDIANNYYDECNFTTFPAYEYTKNSSDQAQGFVNLHRNVIYKNDNVPANIVSVKDIPNLKDMRQTVYDNCQNVDGCEVMAIPHNSNLSRGLMFVLEPGEDNAFRNKMEPLAEIVQSKGSSECDSQSSPNDPYCRFENVQTDTQIYNLGFIRSALNVGLRLESEGQSNPFQLGFVAATDTHNATPGATSEENYKGHHGLMDSGIDKLDRLVHFNPGGLTGVWASENTRDEIYSALQKKETFGTSGPRIKIRMFASWDFDPDGLYANLQDICTNNPIQIAKQYGVPMGSNFPPMPGSSSKPQILVVAAKDPGTINNPSTPLQSIQLIKGYVNESGQANELISVIAGASNNSSSVDLETCEETKGNGRDVYCAVITDNDFDNLRPAYYYARSLENPSCRWSQRLCVQSQDLYTCNGDQLETGEPAFAHCCDSAAVKIIQERAWSSPVWYRVGGG